MTEHDAYLIGAHIGHILGILFVWGYGILVAALILYAIDRETKP